MQRSLLSGTLQKISPLSKTLLSSSNSINFVQNEQKRYLESWESRIYFPYLGNRLRKKYLGTPMADDEEKMKLAKKVKKFTDSKLRNKKAPLLKPGVSLKKHFEELAAKHPKGSVQKPKISELDLQIRNEIIENAETPNNADLIFIKYNQMIDRADMKLYNSILKSCVNSSTEERNYLGEALQIYSDMRKQNLSGNLETYSLLIDLCVSRNHVPRAMYVFKELLARYQPPPKSNESFTVHFQKLQHLYSSLLGLCYKNQASGRVAAIYQLLYQYQNEVLNEFCAEVAGYEPSLAFVSKFVSDEKEAKEFLRQVLNSIDEGSVDAEVQNASMMSSQINSTQIAEQLSQLSIASSSAFSNLVQSIAAQSAAAESITNQEAQDVDVNDVLNPFTVVSSSNNAYYDIEFQQYLDTIYKHEIRIFNRFLAGENKTTNTVLAGVSPDKALEKVAPLNNKYQDLFLQCMNHEEAKYLLKRYKQEKKEIQKEAITKLDWVPVIMGVDGSPFFPKKVSIKEVTGKTIAAAKQEYLDSIKDEVLRSQIKDELYDRIKLCWFDKSKGKVVEGLFY